MKIIFEDDKLQMSISRGDLFDGDVLLSKIIHKFLTKYRKEYDRKNGIHSIPSDYSSVYCNGLIKELTEDEESESLKRWLTDLDSMIYSFHFHAYNNDFLMDFGKEYREELKRLRKLHKKELDHIKKTNEFEKVGPRAVKWNLFNRESELFEDATKVFHEKSEEHNKKVQHGFDLFAKNFKSLWL